MLDDYDEIRALEFMAGHALGVLSSISAEGMPQSALVGIAVTDELKIVFDTLDSTRKYRNLISNAKASFVVAGRERRQSNLKVKRFCRREKIGSDTKKFTLQSGRMDRADRVGRGWCTSSCARDGFGIATSINGRR